jgi:hypothetical protein
MLIKRAGNRCKSLVPLSIITWILYGRGYSNVDEVTDVFTQQINWLVLLIGGQSGIGKTIVAKQVGLSFGAS